MTIETPTTATTENQVTGWRYEQLLHAGYDPTDALILAELRDVDLHLATDLLRAGCDPDTALRILL